MGRIFNICSFSRYLLNTYYVILDKGECNNSEANKKILALKEFASSSEDKNEQCKYREQGSVNFLWKEPVSKCFSL